MKVLFVSTSSGSRGGGELYLLFLGEALAKIGVDVALWCSSNERMDELSSSFGKIGKVYRSDYKNTYDYRLRSIRNLFSRNAVNISEAVNGFEPDVIHLNKQNLEDGLDILSTLDRLDVPFITTIHITQTQKSLGALLGGLRDRVARRFLKQSKSLKWIAISSSRALDLKVFLGHENEKVSMIPNGVKMVVQEGAKESVKQLREKLRLNDRNITVISVGRLEPQKNPARFIEWAAECIQINPDVRFLWIGDGRMRTAFDTKIRSLSLEDKIICMGWQNDVSTFYSIADFYVHTANFEGMPFSLLEAMSFKIPCVVSKELYKDISFPVDVIFSGVDALKLLINDRTEAKDIGSRGSKYISENYSMDVIAHSYFALYEKMKHD